MHEKHGVCGYSCTMQMICNNNNIFLSRRPFANPPPSDRSHIQFTHTFSSLIHPPIISLHDYTTAASPCVLKCRSFFTACYAHTTHPSPQFCISSSSLPTATTRPASIPLSPSCVLAFSHPACHRAVLHSLRHRRCISLAEATRACSSDAATDQVRFQSAAAASTQSH